MCYRHPSHATQSLRSMDAVPRSGGSRGCPQPRSAQQGAECSRSERTISPEPQYRSLVHSGRFAPSGAGDSPGYRLRLDAKFGS